MKDAVGREITAVFTKVAACRHTIVGLTQEGALWMKSYEYWVPVPLFEHDGEPVAFDDIAVRDCIWMEQPSYTIVAVARGQLYEYGPAPRDWRWMWEKL